MREKLNTMEKEGAYLFYFYLIYSPKNHLTR